VRARIAALALIALLGAVAHSAAAQGSFGCRPGPTRAVVDEFVEAFNAGDLHRVNDLFAAIGIFRWYSTTAPGARRGAAAYDRQALRGYLVSRVRERERLRIVRFRFTGAEQGGTLANFVGSLRRSARGFPARTYVYKGAAECSSGEPVLIAWSMVGPVG
jgi:hypothetical protein